MSDLSDDASEQLREITRKRASKKLGRYTTIGEMRDLVNEILHSPQVRIQIAATFEAKREAVVSAFAEVVENKLSL